MSSREDYEARAEAARRESTLQRDSMLKKQGWSTADAGDYVHLFGVTLLGEQLSAGELARARGYESKYSAPADFEIFRSAQSALEGKN